VSTELAGLFGLPVVSLRLVSDGRHVVLPVQARTLAAQLHEHGFEPSGADMSRSSRAAAARSAARWSCARKEASL
jgi:hypothetical protein